MWFELNVGGVRVRVRRMGTRMATKWKMRSGGCLASSRNVFTLRSIECLVLHA